LKEFLETGKIVNVHGLRGDVKIMPWSDDAEFLCEFDVLYCGKDKQAFEVEHARVHKNTVLAKFKGIDTPEAANKLRNSIVYIDRDDIELEEGTYFIADLIGCKVVNGEKGEEIGTITDVKNLGASDIYYIEGKDGKEYMFPAVEEFLMGTDINEKIIKIKVIEGMFSED
jgi:16S rRNA processing protein RimM